MESFLTEVLSFGTQFKLALNPYLLLVGTAGTTLGILWGAIPGLTTTMGMALMIGFSAGMNLHTAVMFLLGVYFGSMFGGSITAIFINIPGKPSSVCTMIEGFPLAKKGEGPIALGVAIFCSALGNILGIVFLIFTFPIVIGIALKFGAWEMFLLTFSGIGISGIVTSGKEHPLKGWISGWIGVLLSLIGLDGMTAYPRFTFGIKDLYGGLEFVPIIIGLFGLTEVVKVLPELTPYVIPKSPGRLLLPWRKILSLVRKHYKTAMRSGLMGVYIGAMPALGSDVASYTGYAVAKQRASAEEKPKYGHGSYEGLVAAEVADNACIGGDLLPTLSLGIPGSAPAACYLGALSVHNIIVGPMINFNHPGLMYFHYAALILTNIIFVFLALWVTGPTIRLLSTPRQVLMPIIVPICVIGAFAGTLNTTDIYVMLIFGLIGYLLTLNGTSVAPMCIGFILGPMADLNFRRAMEIFKGQSIGVVLSRPVGDILILLVIYTYYKGIMSGRKQNHKISLGSILRKLVRK
jgi:putative tricarboxylic transport membrane protein